MPYVTRSALQGRGRVRGDHRNYINSLRAEKKKQLSDDVLYALAEALDFVADNPGAYFIIGTRMDASQFSLGCTVSGGKGTKYFSSLNDFRQVMAESAIIEIIEDDEQPGLHEEAPF